MLWETTREMSISINYRNTKSAPDVLKKATVSSCSSLKPL